MKYNIIMKKLCSFLLLFAIFSSFTLNLETGHAASYSGYAKALSGCVLYKTDSMSDDEQNIIFTIPESYFVYILENNLQSIYKVQYGRYVGFIDASKVVLSTFVPVVKTLDDVTCDIKQTAGTQIWNCPSADGVVLTTISAGTKGLRYIASATGKVPTGGKSDEWFYVCYTPDFNSTHVYEGYVYSENVTNVSKIIFNLESNPEVFNEENIDENNVFIFSSSLKTILIVLIAVPIIFLILVILYKLSKKISKNTNKTIFDKNDISADGVVENENNFSGNKNLKFNFSKFKNLSFVKRHGINSKSEYPEFPKYDSEDDWL